MNRQRIHTDAAPAALGPYSQAICAGNWVFTAGQVALDPNTMRLVEGDVREQTRWVLDNLTAVLHAAGASMADVVKTTVYLLDMAEFTAMNEVYATYFGPEGPPARSTVQVVALPLGGRVEIDCIALVPSEAGAHKP